MLVFTVYTDKLEFITISLNTGSDADVVNKDAENFHHVVKNPTSIYYSDLFPAWFRKVKFSELEQFILKCS